VTHPQRTFGAGITAPPGALPETERRDHEAVAPRRSFFAELPVLVLIAFVLALLLKTFLIQAFYIPSESMLPTLQVSDRVLVNKVVFDIREPRRGEVVVFREDDQLGPAVGDESVLERIGGFLSSGLGASPTERDFIKRIVGLPGETVELRDGVVHIDGQPLQEDVIEDGGYLQARDLNDFGPVTVPSGEYFMMGDNRPNSADSRFGLGTIAEEDLLGRAFVIIWPLTRVDTLPVAGYPVVEGAAAVPAPVDAVAPVQSALPVAPAAPVDPVVPVEPAAPAAPAPLEPVAPAAPATAPAP